MTTRYVVRYGTEYPNVTSASGGYRSETRAEIIACQVLGMETVDEEIISFSQIVRITDDGEQIVNEFEH